MIAFIKPRFVWLAIVCTKLAFLSAEELDNDQVQPINKNQEWQAIAAKQSFTPRSKQHHTLNYKMSWNGLLKAGECTLVFNAKDSDKPQFYTGKAWGRSTGLASALYPYHFNYTAYLNKPDLTPDFVYCYEYEKGDERIINMSFLNEEVRAIEVTKDAETKKHLSTEKVNFPYPNTYDAFTTLLHIGSLPLKNGEDYSVIMMGYKPCVLSVRVEGREKHRGKNCIKLRTFIERINPKTGEIHSHKKLKSAFIWLTDDERRIAVEVRSKVFIGDVRMVLQD